MKALKLQIKTKLQVLLYIETIKKTVPKCCIDPCINFVFNMIKLWDDPTSSPPPPHPLKTEHNVGTDLYINA